VKTEEWILDDPCPECCKRNNDSDKSLCKLYAYDVDCAYMARYKGYLEGQRKLLSYLADNYLLSEETVDAMLKQLEVVNNDFLL
jgi:hypothetical protein